MTFSNATDSSGGHTPSVTGSASPVVPAFAVSGGNLPELPVPRRRAAPAGVINPLPAAGLVPDGGRLLGRRLTARCS